MIRSWLVVPETPRTEPDRIRLAPTRAERINRILDDYPGMTEPREVRWWPIREYTRRAA